MLPVWFGVLVLARRGVLGRRRGRVRALPARPEAAAGAALDREHRDHRARDRRLPAPACARRRRRGRRSRSAAALLHTLNHAVFKALLFLGAGAFERAVGSLELDRLGGLLRRMPWTGGAFLVGAVAIAGLPPLNGFASEWLTLQALLHVPAYGRRRGRHRRGDRARARSPRRRRWRVFCFVKVVGLVLLGAAPARGVRGGRGVAAADARGPSASSRGVRRARGRARACSSARSSGSRPWPAPAPDARRPALAGHGLAADGRDRGRRSSR